MATSTNPHPYLVTGPKLRLGPGLGVHPSRREHQPDPRPAIIPDYVGIADALRHRAHGDPEAPGLFFIDAEERLSSVSNAAMLAWAEAAASALAVRGVVHGDPVLLCFDTCPELIAALFGCSLLGAVPVLTEPPLGLARQLSWRQRVVTMVARARVRALIVDQRLRDLTRGVADEFDGLPVLAPYDLLDTPSITPPSTAARPGDLAFIQFSSGTTAEARGVRVSNAALLANVRRMGERTRYRANELCAGWLPLHHDMGLLTVLWPLLHGTAVALLPPLSFIFKPQRWLWMLHHFRANMSPAPNFGYQLCLNKIGEDQLEGLDLSAWRLALNGAELVLARTLDGFARRFGPRGFGPTALQPVYGLAETVVAATFPEPDSLPRVDHVSRERASAAGDMSPVAADAPDAIAYVSVGRPFPDHALEIVDDEGVALADRREGQIRLRGPSVCPGYVNHPELSAEVFRDGWLWTGDLGYLADGELFVSGRIKDLIIRGGRNYHPHGFEEPARSVEGVRAGGVAAIGVSDPERGTELIYIVVETKLEGEPRRELCAQVTRAVHDAAGVLPDRVIAVPPRTIPKTSSGKVQRAALRELVTPRA